MSRSYRKNKIVGNTIAVSEKQDKVFANKKLRRLVKARISKNCENLPKLVEVSKVWFFRKKGKHYLINAQKKDLSK